MISSDKDNPAINKANRVVLTSFAELTKLARLKDPVDKVEAMMAGCTDIGRNIKEIVSTWPGDLDRRLSLVYPLNIIFYTLEGKEIVFWRELNDTILGRLIRTTNQVFADLSNQLRFS